MESAGPDVLIIRQMSEIHCARGTHFTTERYKGKKQARRKE
jgi:hypothetical protein